ncbi:MAG: PEGA domain-containing protein [Archangium sp.]|nr:PEGA domain-containing protein [Archangium sp.]
MTLRSSVVLLVAVAFSSTAAFAQDDDDLAPLAPLGKPKPKPKPKPRPRPVPAKPKPAPIAADDDLAPIAPILAKGELSVKAAANLAGSVLSIDGKEVGALPLPPLSVATGEHTVTVKRPGYAAFVKKVLVPGGKTVEVEPKLTATSAVLSVTSDVPGAQVLLNGRSIGVVPLTDVEVPPGPAEIAVIKEGFREESQKINFVVGKEYPIVVKFNAVASTTLTASGDRPVDTRLTPDGTSGTPVTGVAVAPAEPITSKWYFWAGIAAGAVAIAVGVGVGVGASQPQPLTEYQICGEGGCDGCIGLTCAAGFRPMGSF